MEVRNDNKILATADFLVPDLKPLERSLRSMQTELEKITKEQKYLRAREQAHRDSKHPLLHLHKGIQITYLLLIPDSPREYLCATLLVLDT